MIYGLLGIVIIVLIILLVRKHHIDLTTEFEEKTKAWEQQDLERNNE